MTDHRSPSLAAHCFVGRHLACVFVGKGQDLSLAPFDPSEAALRHQRAVGMDAVDVAHLTALNRHLERRRAS